jgi:hypothetical protein
VDAADCSEPFLIGLINCVFALGSVPADGGTGRDRAAEIYDRYAAVLYSQALLILGDERMAEQVACDVILDELTGPAVPREGADAASRMAVSVLRRCQALLASGSWPDQAATYRPPGTGTARISWRDFLTSKEREVLGLVLFGGLDSRQAARQLAIPARQAAALLRTALTGLPGRPSRSCCGK